MSAPLVIGVHVGTSRAFNDGRRTYDTAILKLPVPAAHVGRLCLDGDQQADMKSHGGPDRAVLGYSADHLPRWREEQPTFDFPTGSFGENLTIAHQCEETVCIGDVWAIGDVVLEVTYPRVPCFKLNDRSGIPTLLTEVMATGRIGWYYRVLKEGRLEAGIPLALRSRPHPTWTIARAYRLYVALKSTGPVPLDEARELAALPALAEGWRNALPIMIERAEARA
jgi:MOSC domain-containing protein YiiM